MKPDYKTNLIEAEPDFLNQITWSLCIVKWKRRGRNYVGVMNFSPGNFSQNGTTLPLVVGKITTARKRKGWELLKANEFALALWEGSIYTISRQNWEQAASVETPRIFGIMPPLDHLNSSSKIPLFTDWWCSLFICFNRNIRGWCHRVCQCGPATRTAPGGRAHRSHDRRAGWGMGRVLAGGPGRQSLRGWGPDWGRSGPCWSMPAGTKTHLVLFSFVLGISWSAQHDHCYPSCELALQLQLQNFMLLNNFITNAKNIIRDIL